MDSRKNGFFLDGSAHGHLEGLTVKNGLIIKGPN